MAVPLDYGTVYHQEITVREGERPGVSKFSKDITWYYGTVQYGTICTVRTNETNYRTVQRTVPVVTFSQFKKKTTL